MKARLPLSIVLSFLSTSVLAERPADLSCSAYQCVIPYDGEGRQDGVEQCYTDAEKKEKIKEVRWKNGEREGIARCFKNGKISREVTYQHGKIQGLSLEFESNGGAVVDRVEKGLIDGYRFRVDPSGKVVHIIFCYTEGKLLPKDSDSCLKGDYGIHSAAIQAFKLDENKKNKEQAEVAVRRVNGVQETRYPSGGISAVFTNVNGKRHGVAKYFSRTGVLVKQNNFKDGTLDGESLEYTDQGLLAKKLVYNMGFLIALDEYFNNGVLSFSAKKSEKNRYCGMSYFDTGSKNNQFCAFGSLTDRYAASYDGPYLKWSQDGILILKASYSSGKPDGKWDVFTKAGVLDSNMFYTDGVLTKSIDYKTSRKLNGISHPENFQVIKEFFPDGSIKSEKEVSDQALKVI